MKKTLISFIFVGLLLGCKKDKSSQPNGTSYPIVYKFEAYQNITPSRVTTKTDEIDTAGSMYASYHQLTRLEDDLTERTIERTGSTLTLINPLQVISVYYGDTDTAIYIVENGIFKYNAIVPFVMTDSTLILKYFIYSKAAPGTTHDIFYSDGTPLEQVRTRLAQGDTAGFRSYEMKYKRQQ